MTADRDHSARAMRASADRNVLVAFSLVAVVAGMVGLSFAAVPLYRLFCEVTGYGGTTQRAAAAPGIVLDREIVVQFDANVSGLPWSFRPEVLQMRVKLGEPAIINYVAENRSDLPTLGTATFNVQPAIAGIYFNKIECFCFTEQALPAGGRVLMPVQFFVSPELAGDGSLEGTRTLTLSYTFFPAAERQPVARRDGDAPAENM